MRTISALSTVYVRALITAKDEAGNTINVNNDVVQFAIIAPGATPVSGDWHTGSWGATAVARILVGPSGGALTLTAGNQYQVWVKITDSPEVPVLIVDTLNVV